MQVVAGCHAGGAGSADLLARADHLARRDTVVAQVHIDGGHAVAVGFFKPLTKPGLGVEIDEAKVIEFSKNAPDWRNPLWRHEDNSVAEW